MTVNDHERELRSPGGLRRTKMAMYCWLCLDSEACQLRAESTFSGNPGSVDGMSACVDTRRNETPFSV